MNCPLCGSSAFVLATSAECTNSECRNFVAPEPTFASEPKYDFSKCDFGKLMISDQPHRWVTNIDRNQIPTYQGRGFIVKDPQGTDRYTVEKLKAMDIVGAYK